MSAKAIHVKDWRKFNHMVYVGREWGGYKQSDFQNPFHLRDYENRVDCLLAFMVYWYAPEQKHLRDAALELGPDAVLGCWCHPLLCHGDVIAGYINWKLSPQELF